MAIDFVTVPGAALSTKRGRQRNDRLGMTGGGGSERDNDRKKDIFFIRMPRLTLNSGRSGWQPHLQV
jgi:hypothetical protein